MAVCFNYKYSTFCSTRRRHWKFWLFRWDYPVARFTTPWHDLV